MSEYRVLARKYRPKDFDDLIGQEVLVRTLSNAIAQNRLAHAFLLTGIRGIGKTTTARIIARALNCMGEVGQGSATIRPCGVCPNCIAIMQDRHVDVIEMDAASRTGVDDIREIIDTVHYAPANARYKIYIIDEVHMLSKNAFNALLKTLEEPPPHTKFIFATTEIRKVPVTVLSRCQRFDLRRIDSQQLTQHYLNVAAKEDAVADESAIKLIARAADGSVRDGLSLLDQAIARGDGKVTLDDVKDMLGLADRSLSLDLCRQLLRGEMPAALDSFGQMQSAGADPLQVLQDLAELIHLLTKAQAIPSYAAHPDVAEGDRELLTALSDIKIPALTRCWQILLKGITEVQSAANPAQAAEIVLIRLAYAANLPPPGELIEKLRTTAPGTRGEARGSSDAGAGQGPKAARIVSQVSGHMLSQPAARSVSPVPDLNPEPVARSPQPTTFRALVALFEHNREGPLHALLYSQVYPLRLEPGLLDIGVGETVPPNFASRVMQCLSQWTGQRWIVSISDKRQGQTLADEDREQDARRQARVMAHPLMQAALSAFPQAKLTSLTRKSVAPTAAPVDSGAETDIVLTNEDE